METIYEMTDSDGDSLEVDHVRGSRNFIFTALEAESGHSCHVQLTVYEAAELHERLGVALRGGA
jgi:hypothetical protein